jgi:hypothetical protein
MIYILLANTLYREGEVTLVGWAITCLLGILLLYWMLVYIINDD